jgi:hypothetical protein
MGLVTNLEMDMGTAVGMGLEMEMGLGIMPFNRLDTVKQVLQDKYFRWFDLIESEDVTQHPIVGGDGFGSGVSFGYEDGNGTGDGCGFGRYWKLYFRIYSDFCWR